MGDMSATIRAKGQFPLWIVLPGSECCGLTLGPKICLPEKKSTKLNTTKKQQWGIGIHASKIHLNPPPLPGAISEKGRVSQTPAWYPIF